MGKVVGGKSFCLKQIQKGVEMNIGVENSEGRIIVSTPYHPEFPKYAKLLGGKWNSGQKTWSFDIRDEAGVKDLLKDCYGTDGSTKPELVDAQLTLTGTGADQVIWFAGRKVAQRFSRDAPVRLGEQVVVTDGEFCSGGGSRNYPRVTWIGNSIAFEVRDIPFLLVLKEQKEGRDIKIVRKHPESQKEEQDLIAQAKEIFGSVEDALKFALENAP